MNKKKSIVIGNLKGGVGKTPISFNLAFDRQMKIQTNDISALMGCYKNDTSLTNDLKFEENTIYDLGGFTDSGVIDIIKQVDLVIIPVFNDPSSLLLTKKTLKELLPISKKVIIITTRTEGKDSQYIKEDLDEKYPNLTYYNLPLTKAFKATLNFGVSLSKILKDKKQSNYYKNYYKKQYLPFLNSINKELED